MRIDKFLKVSRLLKRRTVASDACSANKVLINGKAVKPSHTVNIGDEISVTFAQGTITVIVKGLNENISAKLADTLYEIKREATNNG